MNYLAALELLHTIPAPRSYLEIGCQYGHSLAISRCPSVAVDPDFQITQEVVAATRVFRMTSDEFFAQPTVQDLVGGSIDLAFIDGMHLAEFALRDFANIERLASERAIIAFDDVLPPDMESASRDRHQKVWTGDVYRTILALKETRLDLDIRVYSVDQKGLCIVSNLNPASGFEVRVSEIQRRLARREWACSTISEIHSNLQPRGAERLESELRELVERNTPVKPLAVHNVRPAILSDLKRFGPSPLLADILAKVDLLASDRERLISKVATAEKMAAELAQERQKVRELKRSLRHSERIRESMIDSASWKITKPYRVARQLAARAYHSIYGPKFLRTADFPEAVNTKDILLNAPPSISAKTKGIDADADIIRSSGLFDPKYYREAFRGNIGDDEDPVSHYCRIGSHKPVAPTIWFNPMAYLHANPSVKLAGLNPLADYLRTMTRYRTGRAALPRVSVSGRIAVYTAVTAGYDELSEPTILPDGVDFFVFTDAPIADGSGWKQLDFDYYHDDPARMSRFVKVQPHLYFQDYEWSIWLDGNISLSEDPKRLVEQVRQGYDWAAFAHPLRSCIYDEASECIRRKKDDDSEIKAQMSRYRRQGYPEKAGLFESGVIVRRHGQGTIKNVMRNWWEEIDNGSKRDQLSLAYVQRKNGINIDLLAREGVCVRTDHRFVYYAHMPAKM